MPEDKRARIEAAARKDVCPQRGRPLLPPPDRVDSGNLADGLFCSLECLGNFHEDYFRERARASNPSRN